MNSRELLTLARFSRDAYPESHESEADWRDRIKSYLPDAHLSFHQNSGSDGFSFRLRGSFYVVVRGTYGTFDWLTDFAKKKESSTLAGKIHSGFKASARRLWLAGVCEALIEAVEDDHRILIGGHSLGAATAIDIAARTWARGLPVDGVLAMNSPRVGDWKFAKAMESINVIRTQNNRDPVSHVPSALSGFKHTGRRIYFDRSGECHVNPSWAYVLHDKITSLWTEGLLVSTFADHSADYNCNLIEKNVSKILQASRS